MKVALGWLLKIMIIGFAHIGFAKMGIAQEISLGDSITPINIDTLKWKIDLLNNQVLASSSYKVHSIVDRIDGRKVLNWDKVLDQSQDINRLFSEYHSELIKLTYFKGQISFSLGLGIGAESSIQIPYNTIAGGIQGNAQYIEQDLFLRMDAFHSSWNEINLGFSYSFVDIKPWITFSGVDGYQNLSFEGGYSIFTPEDLDFIQVDRDLTIDSYEMVEYVNSDSINFNYRLPFSSFSKFKNLGWMIDVGVEYEYNQHHLCISIEDINQIYWKGNQYSASGQEVFRGIDISDSLDENIDFATQDTLDNILGIETQSHSKYNSNVSTKFGFEYEYQLQEFLVLGLRGKYYYHSYYDYYRAQLLVGYQVTNWLYGSLHYILDSNSFNNIGLGLKFSFPHYDFHLNTFNVPAVFGPYDYRQLGLNFGMSIKL